MRIWDIVDKLDPNVQITVEKKNQSPVAGSVTSAVRTVLVLTVALAASSGPKFIQHQGFASCSSSVHFKKASQSVSSGAVRGAVRDADTQHGQSSSKLARSVPSFFHPASDEDEYNDDYSFAR